MLEGCITSNCLVLPYVSESDASVCHQVQQCRKNQLVFNAACTKKISQAFKLVGSVQAPKHGSLATDGNENFAHTLECTDSIATTSMCSSAATAPPTPDTRPPHRASDDALPDHLRGTCTGAEPSRDDSLCISCECCHSG